MAGKDLPTKTYGGAFTITQSGRKLLTNSHAQQPCLVYRRRIKMASNMSRKCRGLKNIQQSFEFELPFRLDVRNFHFGLMLQRDSSAAVRKQMLFRKFHVYDVAYRTDFQKFL